MAKYLVDANLPYYISKWNNPDFSVKAIYFGTPPKVIHLRFGNLKMQEFHRKIFDIWEEIEVNLEGNSIINVYSNRLEFIK